MNKGVRLSIVLLIIVFLFSSIGLAQKDTLKMGYDSDPDTLDLHRASSGLYYHEHIYDTLVLADEEGNFYGLLAKSWSFSDDGTEATFYLRDDVYFHDGTKFNAEAVKFNLERILDPEVASPHGSLIGPIQDLIVVDEYTITLVYDEPFAPLILNYSRPLLAMQSPTAIEKYGDDYGVDYAVGTGPYKFEQWIPGEKIVLVRNEEYTWGAEFFEDQGPAKIERLEFINLPDEMTILLSVRVGDLDIAAVPTPYIDMIREDPNTDVRLSPLATVRYLGLNSSKYPWDNPLVRRAIAHSINREEIIQVAANGYGTPNPTPLAPMVLGYSKTLHEYAAEENIDAGKELLREAGFTETENGWFDDDGKKISLNIWTYTDDHFTRIAEVLREQIIRLGIEVTIETLEAATLLGKTPEGEHDAIAISYGWQDPDILRNFLHSDNLDTSNRVHYVNPKFDELVEKGAATIDPEERFQFYYEAQKIIIQEAPWIPLFTPESALAVNPKLKGLRQAPGTGYPRFLNAYFEN